jgi:dTDP-4-amino-4,6-dideoxygalactose transaminase
VKIPFVNLKRMHDPIRDEIDRAIKEVIDANNYIMGKQIDEFESDYAHFLGVKSVIGMSSGTDALLLILKVLGIKEGDYVVTVPNTFIATTEAITMAGGRILFVDVDEHTSNMSAKMLDEFLNDLPKEKLKKIKAIIFVDLYGNPAGLEEVYNVAKIHRVPLISDAAQAHGASIENRTITDFADFTSYSFFPGKNLGAFGDAGAVAVNNLETAKTLKMLRNHGRTEKYIHPIEAFNCRLDTIQAAVLKVKLKYLEQWNKNRIKAAQTYNSLLEKKGYPVPVIEGKYKHVFHLYVTRSKDREQLIEKLDAAGVSTGIHYPLPLHLQPAYCYLGYKEDDFPVSEALAREILSLPIDGSITQEEVEYICSLM